MTATSSQRPNLRPTWRSTPTRSKPHARVQRARRHAARLDAGDHGVEPRVTGDVDEAGRGAGARCRARCGRGARTRSPRRWCGRRPAPCTATATRSRRPGHRPAVTIEHGHDRAERPGPGRQPRPLVVERAGHEVERRGAGGDLAVVDRHDRLGVVGGRQSDGRVGHGRAMVIRRLAAEPEAPGGIVTRGGTLPASVRGSAALRNTALLAQSVEHSHGKAGVVGSIPTEGSTTRSVRLAGATPGGVAQLVRASGS